MKRIIGIFFIIIIMNNNIVYATQEQENSNDDIISEQIDNLDIGNFVKKSKEYSGEFMKDINISDLLNSAISGRIDNNTLFKKVIKIFGKEVKDAIKVLGSIIIIIVIHSILKSISDSLENKSISTIAYYVQYILIVTLIMSNFASIIALIKESIQNMVGFSKILVPLLMTLILATGNITSAGIIEPIILFLINLISNLFEVIVIPIILVSTAISIISKISDKIQINKLSKFMKSSVVWGLGIILTLFVSILSLDGTLSSTVDGVTAKTAKAAVSNLIPVVGKILGDSVDTVIGCSNIIKNAVGIVGIIIIAGICIMPIIKLTVLTIIYNLTATLCQPIGDEKIVSLLEEMGGTFKILLAIMCSISVMLIIGTTIVLKISNSSLMYR